MSDEGRALGREMNWPKKWVAVLTGKIFYDAETDGWWQRFSEKEASKVLKKLHKAGALKDPPKPREWYLIKVKGRIGHTTAPKEFFDPSVHEEIIHVREVTEGSCGEQMRKIWEKDGK